MQRTLYLIGRTDFSGVLTHPLDGATSVTLRSDLMDVLSMSYLLTFTFQAGAELTNATLRINGTDSTIR